MSINTAAGTRIHLKSEPTPPPTPEHKMTKTKLLVITNEGHMSSTSLAEFTARAQGIADKVGAELLVLGPGQGADLIIAPVMLGKVTAGEIKEALRNSSASREAYWAHAVGSAPLCAQVEALTAIQGEAISSCLDPLEQAIESTVRALRDEHQQMAETGAKQDSALCDRLGTHLDALLAKQLERVTADGVQTDDEVSEQIAALQQSVRVIHGRQDRVFLATGIEGA